MDSYKKQLNSIDFSQKCVVVLPSSKWYLDVGGMFNELERRGEEREHLQVSTGSKCLVLKQFRCKSFESAV